MKFSHFQNQAPACRAESPFGCVVLLHHYCTLYDMGSSQNVKKPAQKTMTSNFLMFCKLQMIHIAYGVGIQLACGTLYTELSENNPKVAMYHSAYLLVFGVGPDRGLGRFLQSRRHRCVNTVLREAWGKRKKRISEHALEPLSSGLFRACHIPSLKCLPNGGRCIWLIIVSERA